MRKNSIAVALGLCAVMLLATAAPAQRHKKTTKRTTHTVARKGSTSGAETGLVGIKLFDTGTRVVSVYGSPDAIEAVTLGGGGAAGPGGGPAGGPRGAALPGGGGGAGAAGPPIENYGPGGVGDFGFGDSVLNMQKGGGAVAGPPNDGGGGGPMTPGGGMGPGGGVGGVGSNDRIVFTRWVYNRNASKYGFILDKFNRVVQIEAIGMQAGKARTRRGLSFGSNWATMIKKYGAPDGYEIAGDNIVARYLSKNKVAFRFSRLGENKPHVITGIVVAAGKR